MLIEGIRETRTRLNGPCLPSKLDSGGRPGEQRKRLDTRSRPRRRWRVCGGSRCVAKRHNRQGDLKCRTLRARFGEDQTACVSFNDRTADRQTQSHTRRLSRKERLKYAALVLRVDSRSSVLDGQEHVRIFTEPRANVQSAVANRNGVHGLDRVLDQIQNHLL